MAVGVFFDAPFCLLDNDCDVIPYPTLILSKLDGELAESIFEHSTHDARIKLSHTLGDILAAIHTVPVSSSQVPNKPLFSLNGWREKVEDGLLKDEGLREVIEGLDQGFYVKLQGLLDQVPALHFDEKYCLIWGDPNFHNFHVQVAGDDIRLCGVFDFQTAGLGNPLFDMLYLEGNFRRTQADGLYQDATYLQACQDAYVACGMALPPSVTKSLTGVIEGLEWLKVNAKPS